MADGALAQNVTKREQAAILIADDDLTDEAIAVAVGVQRRTLARWKNDPEFAAMVGDRIGDLQAAMLKHTIAKKHKRLAVLDDLHDRALTVIANRAKRHAEELAAVDDPDQATRRFFGDAIPLEAATGLMVRQESVNAQGMKTVNWSVDTGLIREIRALHEQAAKELGQWEERINHTGGITREYRIITGDDD